MWWVHLLCKVCGCVSINNHALLIIVLLSVYVRSVVLVEYTYLIDCMLQCFVQKVDLKKKNLQ